LSFHSREPSNSEADTYIIGFPSRPICKLPSKNDQTARISLQIIHNVKKQRKQNRRWCVFLATPRPVVHSQIVFQNRASAPHPVPFRPFRRLGERVFRPAAKDPQEAKFIKRTETRNKLKSNKKYHHKPPAQTKTNRITNNQQQTETSQKPENQGKCATPRPRPAVTPPRPRVGKGSRERRAGRASPSHRALCDSRLYKERFRFVGRGSAPRTPSLLAARR